MILIAARSCRQCFMACCRWGNRIPFCSNRCQIYNKKLKVYSIAQQSSVSRNYCSIMLQKLIAIPSAPLAANRCYRQLFCLSTYQNFHFFFFVTSIIVCFFGERGVISSISNCLFAASITEISKSAIYTFIDLFGL